MRSSRDAAAEIAAVAKEINGLLGELDATVAALNSIISTTTTGKSHGG